MNPLLAVFDDFLPPDIVGETMSTGEFGTVENPVDGVKYHGIAHNIHPVISRHIGRQMTQVFGQRMIVNYQFARLMTKDTTQSLIHSDQAMGEYSLHIYLNANAPETTGTQFWYSPKFGSQHHPSLEPIQTSEFYSPGLWHRRTFVGSRLNRALLHDSRLWHSGEPALGFGTDQFDGRLVLTTFLSRSHR